MYEGDFMKKRHLFVAFAIFMVTLAFSSCDLIDLTGDDDDIQEPYGPLEIKGKSDKNEIIVITFSTTRVAEKGVMPYPKDNDSYEIKLVSTLVSKGVIKMDTAGNTVFFIEKTPREDYSFNAAYDKDKKSLKFPNDEIPTSPTPIKGFKSDTDTGVVNPNVDAVAKQLDKSGKIAIPDSDGNIVVSGPIVLEQNVDIPDSIKLIFNSKDNGSSTDPFSVKDPVTDKFSVTAKGGIVVRDGRGVRIGNSVKLIVEGDSAINGRLIVEAGAALDIAGDFKIESGGVVELAGGETADKVSNAKYKISYQTTPVGGDAAFKLRGNLIVRYGGRFQMPDPLCFFTYTNKDNDITGVIKVESGGELILVTADPNGYLDLHPLIGTLSTATRGAPVGADFVMDPDIYPTHKDSMIEARISSKTFALELTGNARAVGRLILDKKYNNRIKNDNRIPPYRLEVWLTYPFTVNKGSDLRVGISDELYMRSSLLVTGMSYPMGDKPSYYYKGVLTNNSKITVSPKNGIMEWFGGYFDHKGNVNGVDKAKAGDLYYENYFTDDPPDPPDPPPDPPDPPIKYGIPVKVKVWSPDWPGDTGDGDNWWLEWLDNTDTVFDEDDS